MINRRQFLQISGAGAAGVLTGGLTSLLSAGRANAAGPGSSGFTPDLDIALEATAGEIPILPGNPTGVWRFQGRILKGDRASLVHLERSYLGPIIRARTGQKVRIRFTNDMAWTINGRTFRMEQVAPEERVAMNTLEVWEFINEGGGMGMMRNYLVESTTSSA